MKRSLQKHLRWISIAILLGYASVNAQEKITCKASVVFHGRELSGRMMFKQVHEDAVRFAFFNELGMSFVEGSLSVSGRRSAVSGQRSAVSGHAEISKIAPFLDYKSFRRNLERGLNSFLWDQREEKLHLPILEDESVEMTKIYKRGRKFVFSLQLASLE